MRRTISLSLLLLTTIAPALRAGEFDWIARNVERESGCKRTHIPFFGVAKFVVAVGHPAGASQLDLAVFEDTNISPERFSDILSNAAGSTWKPMIRVRSKRGESTTIFAQQDGKRVRLLIGNFDHREATLVQIRVNVDKLLRYVDDCKHHDGLKKLSDE